MTATCGVQKKNKTLVKILGGVATPATPAALTPMLVRIVIVDLFIAVASVYTA